MLERLALVLVSVLVLAWGAVLLHDHRIGQAAFSDVRHDPRGAGFDHDIQQLEDARFLDPDSQWDLYRGSAYLARGRRREAFAVLDDLVRREPDNAQAWSVLSAAAAGIDPGRAREASAQLERLAPLGR